MRKTQRTLSIEPKASSAPPAPPPARGRLWYDFEIPDQFYNGLPKIGQKVRWVRSHLPQASRIKIGQSSAWYEADILAHLEAERGQSRRVSA